MRTLPFVLALLVVTLSWGAGETQELPPPTTFPSVITGDFGPRNIAPPSRFFHKGIDYRAVPGDAALAVESGIIDLIKYESGGAGWYVIIRDQFSVRRFGYLHLFTDSADGICTTLCLRTFSTWLGDLPVGLYGFTYAGRPCQLIVFWLDTENADRAYTDCRDSDGPARILIGGITSQGSVERGEWFAPTGRSGGVDPHLHLKVNDGAYNPLADVSHDSSSFKVGMRRDGSAFITDDGFLALGRDFPAKEIVITVDSTSGLDLNRVVIKVHRDEAPAPNCASDEIARDHLCKIFEFGGKANGPTATPNVMDIIGDQNSFVAPQNLGLREFHYDFIDWAKLAPGLYRVAAEATSVRDASFTLEDQSPTVMILGEFANERTITGNGTFSAVVPREGTCQWNVAWSLNARLTANDGGSGVELDLNGTRTMTPVDPMPSPSLQCLPDGPRPFAASLPLIVNADLSFTGSVTYGAQTTWMVSGHLDRQRIVVVEDTLSIVDSAENVSGRTDFPPYELNRTF